MRQHHRPNLTPPNGEGDLLNVRLRKTSLIPWWKSGGKHQPSLGKGLFRLPWGLWLYKFFLFSSRNGFNENRQKRALLAAQVGYASDGERSRETIHSALGLCCHFNNETVVEGNKMLKTRQEGGGRGKVTSLLPFCCPSNSCLVHIYLCTCCSPPFPAERLIAFVGDSISSTCQKILMGLKIKPQN